MKYKGHKLLLDNFRSVLKGYSVDIQDVVRSAILDDVDVSEYIDSCSPYKLDQIRLCLKEGISSSYFVTSGEVLYKLRCMVHDNVDISPIEKYLRASLSDEHLEYLLSWLKDGVNFSSVNVATIKKFMLPVYDKGLRWGINMKKYLKIDSKRYLELCIQMERQGIDTSVFLRSEWDCSVMEFLSRSVSLSAEDWDKIYKYIGSSDSVYRVQLLVQMIKNNIDIKPWQATVGTGYKYSSDCLKEVLNAYGENMDISEFLKANSYKEVKDMYAKMKLSKEAKVSGRFVKKQKREI